MKHAAWTIALASALVAGCAGAVAAVAAVTPETVDVGGAAMYPDKNIMQNAINSKDHTTLVAAVKAAGLVPTLEGPGPFTVFAPTDAAFDQLPPDTVQKLLMPQNKSQLVKVLTYHVVPGRYTKSDLKKLIREGGGKAELKTAEGGMLTVMMNGPQNIQLKDGTGGVADITTYDVMQKNGAIDVTDHVLLPQ